MGFNIALYNIYKDFEGVLTFYGRMGIVFSIFIVQWLRLFNYSGLSSSIIFLIIVIPSLIASGIGIYKVYGKEHYHREHWYDN